MAVPRTTDDQLLYDAAVAATRAPSILNTQPWRWRVGHGTLSLWADPSRQVLSIDPERRLLTLSCGGALHHGYTLIRARGHDADVSRCQRGAQPDLLAEITVGGPHAATALEVLQARSISQRHSDRRAVAATSHVSDDIVRMLQSTAAEAGARLHRIDRAQLPFLTAAARRAQETEAAHDMYQSDLIAWTDERPSGEGVPFDTLVATTARSVPLRDFAGGGETGLHPGFGDDSRADFLIIATDGDEPDDWLHAGEAMSAAWLTATGHEVAASVLSDVIEVAEARSIIADLLPEPGHPQLVFRIGIAAQPTPPPASPRRDPATVITVENDA
jgi:hypothetical protein